MASLSAEGAHVGAVILLVGAGGAFGALDVEHDADFAIVRCADGAVGEFCPCRFPVGEFCRERFVGVAEHGVPSRSA